MAKSFSDADFRVDIYLINSRLGLYLNSKTPKGQKDF